MEMSKSDQPLNIVTDENLDNDENVNETNIISQQPQNTEQM
jgi:hypothetical protein